MLPCHPVWEQKHPLSPRTHMHAPPAHARFACCAAPRAPQVHQLEARIAAAVSLAARCGAQPRPKVAFLEWTDPMFVGGHWTPQLIAMAGGDHPLNPPK